MDALDELKPLLKKQFEVMEQRYLAEQALVQKYQAPEPKPVQETIPSQDAKPIESNSINYSVAPLPPSQPSSLYGAVQPCIPPKPVGLTPASSGLYQLPSQHDLGNFQSLNPPVPPKLGICPPAVPKKPSNAAHILLGQLMESSDPESSRLY